MPEYTINGTLYTQSALVLGQWRQLLNILKDVAVPADASASQLAVILGDRLPAAFAVVLNPEGVSLRDKNLPAVADDLEFSLSTETAIQVIEDFFVCNPLSSLLKRIGGVAGKLTPPLEAAATPLTGLSSSSAEGISPSGTASSGE
jgi:hypothetical protein